MIEGEPWNQPLLTRGDWKKEEAPVPRGFLETFGPRRFEGPGSGRLQLAEALTNPENPLVTRVLVNRLWHHVFGRGIVATPDNFGHLGARPTHPELLDHLALSFQRDGWSIRRLVERLVLSRAFRSSSQPLEKSAERDPDGRFLTHYRPRRLEAEAILDTLRFLAAGTLSGTRRALYEPVRRNQLHLFLKAFNYPIPTTTVGARDQTGEPAQALTLMNGETVRQAAHAFAKRIERNPELTSLEERLHAMFLEAYSRRATPDELAQCTEYVLTELEDPTREWVTRAKALEQRDAELARERAKLLAPVKTRARQERAARGHQARSASEREPLKPIARWDFEQDARDVLGTLHGSRLEGDATVEKGALHLRGGAHFSAPLETTLHARTLEVLLELDTLDQRAGGAMVLQSLDGHRFDGIVYAELQARRWLSGSDYHRRTTPLEGPPETQRATVHLIFVYHANGRIEAYRDGEPYGLPYAKAPSSYEAGKAQVVFGLRHGTVPIPARALTGKILEARLYDRALSSADVRAANEKIHLEAGTEKLLRAMLTPEDRARLDRLDAERTHVNRTIGELRILIEDARKARIAAGTGLARLAHVLLNSRELIHVH